MAGTKWNTAVLSREEQRRRKRDAVLSVGARLFNERGYENTALDDIAKELNISKRTIYYYVQNKEDILFECNRIGLEFIRDLAAECAASPHPPVEKIALFIDRYIARISTDFGACMVLTQASPLSEERRTEIRKSMLKLDNILRDVVREGIEDGSIEPMEPRLVTAAIFGAMNWLAHWNRNNTVADHDPVRETFSRIFLNGIIRGNAPDLPPMDPANFN